MGGCCCSPPPAPPATPALARPPPPPSSLQVRRKIEERQKAAEAEARARQVPLTDRQIAALKQELIDQMQVRRGERVWVGGCEVLKEERIL